MTEDSQAILTTQIWRHNLPYVVVLLCLVFATDLLKSVTFQAFINLEMYELTEKFPYKSVSCK